MRRCYHPFISSTYIIWVTCTQVEESIVAIYVTLIYVPIRGIFHQIAQISPIPWLHEIVFCLGREIWDIFILFLLTLRCLLGLVVIREEESHRFKHEYTNWSIVLSYCLQLPNQYFSLFSANITDFQVSPFFLKKILNSNRAFQMCLCASSSIFCSFGSES